MWKIKTLFNRILNFSEDTQKPEDTYLLRTIGTAMEGFFLRPSMISAALSAYILWSAFLWMTSEVPPRVLSKRNLACSSADKRESFFCIASRTRIVARLVSKTTSSLKQNKTKEECAQAQNQNIAELGE